MNINIDKLERFLRSTSQDQLDAILEFRDSEVFERLYTPHLKKYWNESIRFAEAKELFIRLSNATEQHEIVSYISDDLDLITAYRLSGQQNDYMDEMVAKYENGEMPGFSEAAQQSDQAGLS